jgi:hypothetical protein
MLTNAPIVLLRSAGNASILSDCVTPQSPP